MVNNSFLVVFEAENGPSLIKWASIVPNMAGLKFILVDFKTYILCLDLKLACLNLKLACWYPMLKFLNPKLSYSIYLYPSWIFGQRPQYGTKFCRIGKNSLDPSVHPSPPRPSKPGLRAKQARPHGQPSQASGPASQAKWPASQASDPACQASGPAS